MSPNKDAFPAKAGIFFKNHKIPAFAGNTIFLFTLLVLTACQTTLPTSERLELVRAQKEQALKTELASKDLQFGSPLFIRVFKEEERLETWIKDQNTGRFAPFKAYEICNFSGTLGPKLAEGDRQAPEGFYVVGAEQMNPWSSHHLSFNLGYPNDYDRAFGRTGSLLMIHGGCKSEGCFAMTNNAMEEVYLLTEASISKGNEVPVHIFPFRMTAQNMFTHRDHKWIDFWFNLKEGYDAFETSKQPPVTGHQDLRYVFKTPDRRIALY